MNRYAAWKPQNVELHRTSLRRSLREARAEGRPEAVRALTALLAELPEPSESTELAGEAREKRHAIPSGDFSGSRAHRAGPRRSPLSRNPRASEGHLP